VKPILLLIPGMLNTSAVWAKVIPLLHDVADVRVLNVQTQSSIEEMTDDALALVADVLPEQALVVCGFSMGGFVAINLIASHNQRIQAVCLLDTTGRPELAESAAQREKTIAAIERDFDKVTLRIGHFSTCAESHNNPALMDAILTDLRAVGPDTAIAQNRAVMARADHRATLAKLNMPVLVLCGKDDLVTPPECSEELAALIPGAQLEWIEGAGHMVPMEQPLALANCLKRFIARFL
jgi:pimeloyl-ACP methyl ester carboxylesterase